MTEMFFGRILAITISLLAILHNDPPKRDAFISPLKIPIALSANFGELRANHFHSGLDIKTQGVTGKEVVAAAPGYVYRISVSPGGFGKALYLRHPSGFSTVYGHLDRFSPEIEAFVKSRQYDEKSFLVNLFPPSDRFRFNQGDVIAYSGNSGSSSGPHLHYEIRKTDGERPLNPLLFEFDADDRIKPVIERLVIYPASENTMINNQKTPRKITLTGTAGNYRLPSGTGIRISGPAGFGIKAWDQFSNSLNKCALYSVELFVDSTRIFRYRMDDFSFDDTRYINSHIDYETYIKDNVYIQKLYVLPNDRLNIYSDLVNRGIYNFTDDKRHQIKIIVTDFHNNTSVLSFSVTGDPPSAPVASEDEDKEHIVMPYSRNNRFIAGDVSVSIPSGALYDTLLFKYSRSPGSKDMFSDVHHIHDIYTPLHKSYTLTIRPQRIPEGLESKMLIVQTGANNRRTPVTGRWVDGSLTADLLSFGNFYIGADTISPVITPVGMSQGADLSGREMMRFRISDNFSGIGSWEPLIDGKWALFEYDQKNNMLIYRFDPASISKGSRHTLALKVSDNTNNVKILNFDFKW